LSCQATAGSLCASAFQKRWIRPLLLVTEPVTTNWKGIPTPCDSPLDLPEWKAPDPSTPNPPNQSFTSGAPVATSVATNSCSSWDALQGKAASRLSALLSKVPILVNPDARTLAGYICVRNPSGLDTSSLLEANPLISKKIWVPGITSDASAATTPLAQVDTVTTAAWGTLTNPQPLKNHLCGPTQTPLSWGPPQSTTPSSIPFPSPTTPSQQLPLQPLLVRS